MPDGIAIPRSRWGRARLRRKLERDLRKRNREEINSVLAQPLTPFVGLPGTRVTRDGVTYEIHGLVHDQSRFGLRMRPEVRETIRACIIEFDSPSAGYLLEGGFGKTFDLARDREMQVFDDVLRKVGGRGVLAFALHIAVTLPLWPFGRLLVRLSRDVALRELWRCLDDLRHVDRARELYRLTRLPEPLAMDLQTGPVNRFFTAMSEAMADEMRRRAREQGWEEVHCVCGLAHEGQIAWLLQQEPR